MPRWLDWRTRGIGWWDGIRTHTWMHTFDVRGDRIPYGGKLNRLSSFLFAGRTYMLRWDVGQCHVLQALLPAAPAVATATVIVELLRSNRMKQIKKVYSCFCTNVADAECPRQPGPAVIGNQAGRQPHICLSHAGLRLLAISQPPTCELRWLRLWLTSLGLHNPSPTNVCERNGDFTTA